MVADYYQDDHELLEDTIILRITRQLLETLAAMHNAGYAHGGMSPSQFPGQSRKHPHRNPNPSPASDISGANMAFTARGLRNLSVASLFEVIGAPATENLVRRDGGSELAPGLPAQLVKKVGWDRWVDEDEEDIRLIDFGEAFPHGTVPAELAQPSDLQVPEKIFTGGFDYRIDLWRAGCLVRSRESLDGRSGGTGRQGLMVPG